MEIEIYKYCNNTSLDGASLKEDETLVPALIRDGYKLSATQKTKLITWKIANVKFQIGFIPIPAENFKSYMVFFEKEINDFLKKYRTGRCIVDHRSDGTPIFCSKKNKCTGCSKKGLYPRNQKLKDLSLEEFYDNNPNLIDDNAIDPSDNLIRQEKESLGDPYTRLITHFRATNPRYAKIVELKKQRISDKEIVIRLGLKPSRGYQEINNAYLAAKSFFDNEV